jgi:hypothetical protein
MEVSVAGKMSTAELERWLSRHSLTVTRLVEWLEIWPSTFYRWRQEEEYPRWLVIIVRNERPPLACHTAANLSASEESVDYMPGIVERSEADVAGGPAATGTANVQPKIPKLI